MGLSFPTLPIAKKYTSDTAEEFGAVKGAPIQLESYEHDSTNHVTVLHLKWENSQGEVQRGDVSIPDGAKGETGAPGTNGTDGKDGANGVGIASITADTHNAMITVHYTDGTSSNPIAIPTVPGEDGVSPIVTVHESTSTVYTLDITDASGTITTPNLKGQDGTGGETRKVITASVDVGGIDKNTTFPIGTDYDDLWEALLDKTIYPTFTEPSASLTYSVDAYAAVGDTISAKSASLSYNAGAITLDGVKQANRGGSATNYAVATTGADTEYSDSSASSGSFSIPALTRANKGTIKLTGTVSYAEGAQPKDSKGANYSTPLPAGSVSSEKTITFIQPFYYGASDSSTVADFTGLTKNVTPKGNKTFNFTTNNQHTVFAYDSSYGNLSSILDQNGFEVMSGWTKSTLTVGGFSYYVYVANSKTTDTNAAFTFKF